MEALENRREHVIALFRIVIGLLFACHGAATLFDVLGGQHAEPSPGPSAAWPGWWAAVVQLAGGTLVLCGLGTRTAAVLCSRVHGVRLLRGTPARRALPHRERRGVGGHVLLVLPPGSRRRTGRWSLASRLRPRRDDGGERVTRTLPTDAPTSA
ncbi:DoxX family protein [Streptomyces violaceorubidus]